MSIFIIGKSGYIAKRLIDYLDSNPIDNQDINVTSSHTEEQAMYLNLLEPQSFDYSMIKENDFIVLLAAISSPDICNRDYDTAYEINVSGTAYFISKCIERNARVLFMSSDTVYGLQQSEVDENTDTNPIGNYALMKQEIEQKFMGYSNFKVFRLSYIFSREDKFTSYIHGCCRKGEVVDVFHPIFRRTVYIEDLIQAIITIEQDWDEWSNQIFNICGPSLLSRVDLVQFYKFNVNNELEYRTTEPDESFFKARPKTIDMASIFFEKLLKRKPIKIDEAMSREFS
ncbi:NAD-dependent epimerase/dehydratase family protein [Paenibacillus guangzhouensis]|uniref:NAD-dependent epimerase/dehydratase family protein n=1 Tax=Paenibacillus guangzhouensis TaxID=1473112 RepID=UPI0012673AE1|nr:SDR family oxidoreductase [Paenibacillus guangzhouensis]